MNRSTPWRRARLLVTIAVMGAWVATADVAAGVKLGPVIPLASGLEVGTTVVIDVAWPPTSVELVPEDVAIASTWYRVGDGFLVRLRLPYATHRDSALRLVPRAGSYVADEWPRIRLAATPAVLPLRTAVRANAIVLRVPPLDGEHTLSLRGALDAALVLLDGEAQAPLGTGSFDRFLFDVAAGGARELLVVAASPADEVLIRSATIHAAVPLPAMETFSVGARESAQLEFEIAERTGPAWLTLEAFDVAGPGELRIELEGERLIVDREPLQSGKWSRTRLELPARSFARFRPSRLRVAVRGPIGPSADAGAGVRRLQLDEPLPLASPMPLTERPLLLGFVPSRATDHRLDLVVSDLRPVDTIDVVLDGEPIGTVEGRGGETERAIRIAVPSALLEPGRLAALELVVRTSPTAGGGPVLTAAEVVAVVPVPPPPVAPSYRDGPPPSVSELGPPGRATHEGSISRPQAEDPYPGRKAEPVGVNDLFFGVPVLQPEYGEPPAVQRAEWAADINSSVVLDRGPVLSGSPILGDSDVEPLPGQPTLMILSPSPYAEVFVPPPTEGDDAGLRMVVRTDPPGAAVFLSTGSGFRGQFLGLTPVEIRPEFVGPARLLLALPGYQDAELDLTLPAVGTTIVSRSMLPFRGIDFAAPEPLLGRRLVIPRTAYLAPAGGDLDHDGRHDLVIGDATGRLRWLRNESVYGRPTFGEVRSLTGHDGRPLVVDGYAVPALADWNRDGRPDLLVGSRSGEIHLYLRSAEMDSIGWEERGVIVADGAPLSVGNGAAPLVVDWNDDSVPDLLVGSGYGVCVLFLGTGSGAVTQVGSVMVEGRDAEFTLDTVPIAFEDWTGDGVPELIVADMYGHVWQFPGRQRGGVPDFAPPESLTFRAGLDLYIGTYPHGFSADLDGDGHRDLVLGNAAAQLLWLRGGAPGDFDELEPLFPDELPSSGLIIPTR